MVDNPDKPRMGGLVSGAPVNAPPPADTAKLEAVLRELEKAPQPAAIDNLIDAMVDDVLQTPGADLLAEVAADHGNPEVLAIECDGLAGIVLNSAGNAQPLVTGRTSRLSPSVASRL